MTLDRIKQQPYEDRISLAIATLMWISYAKRPLSVCELRHAVATQPGLKTIDDSYLTVPELITECCMGLVALDTEASVIRFTHLTVEEFLQQRRSNLFTDGSKTITRACLTYLTFDDFSFGPCPTNGEVEKRLSTFPFLGYASGYWGDHAADSFDEDIKGKVLEFATNNTNLAVWSQLEGTREKNWKPRFFGHHGDDEKTWEGADGLTYEKNLSLLHIAARFGIQGLVDQSTETFTSNINAETSKGRTPLMLAAKFAHEPFVRTLYSYDTLEANKINDEGETALILAIKFGSTSVIETLMKRSSVDINLGSPLVFAIEEGDQDTVYRLLSDSRLDVNSTTIYGGTPLCQSMLDFQFDVFTALLNQPDLQPFSESALARLSFTLKIELEDQDFMSNREFHDFQKMLVMLLQIQRREGTPSHFNMSQMALRSVQ